MPNDSANANSLLAISRLAARLLAWDDFHLVPFDHMAPAVAFLVMQPIDFFGIERRQAAGDPLSSQIIFFGRIPHVGDDRIVAALDAEFFTARLLNQLTGVPKTNGQELQEIGRIGLLPGIVPLFPAPLDETGPTRAVPSIAGRDNPVEDPSECRARRDCRGAHLPDKSGS